MTNRPVLKDHERKLMRINEEINDIAKAIERLGDRFVSGELVIIQLILSAFTINSELRARQGGERTPEELSQCRQFMLNISKIHKGFAEVILRDLAAAEEEEEEPAEEMKK
jgi:hypothetical protein